MTQEAETQRRHHPFGPSSLKRRELCPASARLEEGLEDSTNEAAERGILLHNLMERYINGTEPTAEELDAMPMDIAEDYSKMVSAYIDIVETKANGTPGVAEVRLSASMYGSELYFGTADVIMTDGDGGCVIIDWKTGRHPVDKASENLQGAAYALAAFQEYGYDHVTVCFYGPYIGYSEYTFTDPAPLLDTIAGIISAASRKDAPMVPGDEQCRFCKAALNGTCPAFMGQADQLAVTAEQRPVPITLLADAELSELYTKLKMIERLSDTVSAELMKRCEASGASVGSYKIKMSSGGRELKNIVSAWNAVKVNDGSFPQELFLSCCTLSVSQLEAAWAKHRKDDGTYPTLKAGKEAFGGIVGGLVTEKPPRKSLVKEC